MKRASPVCIPMRTRRLSDALSPLGLVTAPRVRGQRVLRFEGELHSIGWVSEDQKKLVTYNTHFNPSPTLNGLP